MKTSIFNLVFIAIITMLMGMPIAWLVLEVYAAYQYESKIGSYWSLAVQASTLTLKSDYIDKFVAALEREGLDGNDAIFLKTPDNSFEQNMTALKSLQRRLHEIHDLDVNSFAYQQAISQITAQEQGEAKEDMLEVFQGCWYLRRHPLLWGWIDFIAWCVLLIGAVIGGVGGIIALPDEKITPLIS